MVGSHLLPGVQVGFTVQAAYPPVLQGFVVGWLVLGLHTPLGIVVSRLGLSSCGWFWDLARIIQFLSKYIALFSTVSHSTVDSQVDS